MDYGLRVTVDPTSEPLSLSETKTYLRVDSSDDDDLILSLIVAARQYCEAVTKRSFADQTMQMVMDEWPSGDTLEMPRPFQSSTSTPVINYYTTGSTSATLFAASNYWVDNKRDPGRIVLRDNKDWPSDQLRTANGVEVTLKSGYGGQPDTPDSIKTAMRLLVGHWYTNREAVVVGTISSAIETTVTALLTPFIVPFVP